MMTLLPEQLESPVEASTRGGMAVDWMVPRRHLLLGIGKR